MTTTQPPLSILVSSRIRLSEDERRTLKNAYRDLTEGEQPAVLPEQGTSGLRTVNAITTTEVDHRIGMNRLVFMDVVNSRDSISVAMILRLQKGLGVTIIDKKRMMKSCKDYVDHIFNE